MLLSKRRTQNIRAHFSAKVKKIRGRTGSHTEHVSKQLQIFHKLPGLGCCICFLMLMEKAEQVEMYELNHEVASTGEETILAVNHQLGKEVFAGW